MRLPLWSFLMPIAALSAHAATVTVVQHTPYRSLQDSPWHTAVAAGDSLKFADQFCNDPATTLPNGLGVHDDFEMDDCLSPWLSLVQGKRVTGTGGSVDADDGLISQTPSGSSFTQVFNPATQRVEARLGFIMTSDGKYPQWLGFDVTASNALSNAVFMDLLGVNGEAFATINLTDYLGTYLDGDIVADDKFLGFIADQPVKEVFFYGGGIGLDHFQYGYGAGPIPEPSIYGLALAAVGICLRRRR